MGMSKQECATSQWSAGMPPPPLLLLLLPLLLPSIRL
jgi:hypothetical protein